MNSTAMVSSNRSPRTNKARPQKDLGLLPQTPTWEATQPPRMVLSSATGFDPRPRVGATDFFIRELGYFLVSIHAPAWGATVGLESTGSRLSRFDPRPRVGGRPCALTLAV
ncbi:hypothetical protein PHAMO_10307 [Magnetospirillum molischianum DSM 120]|uniref:Uncharacterized protein n=1 Tax=Magnetospirillum molischianum DSM 120 TaxID=1150626 RepID=H8FNE4_MAGML|nr:hypothetical protein PHAMO_10307 [Magnetospirillum molischianum DSM 120]